MANKGDRVSVFEGLPVERGKTVTESITEKVVINLLSQNFKVASSLFSSFCSAGLDHKRQHFNSHFNHFI